MPEPLNVRLGHVVRRRREAAGRSQEQLASEVKPELTRQYIGMVERGETNPTLSVIESLAVAFGTSASELIREAERDEAPKAAPPKRDKKKP